MTDFTGLAIAGWIAPRGLRLGPGARRLEPCRRPAAGGRRLRRGCRRRRRTAEGEQRTVDAGTDPDLFWALRGGGGGYVRFLTPPPIPMCPSRSAAGRC
jgi:hypothetical protein